jgi:glycosyltransferase involved in cell wall biosynthesis
MPRISLVVITLNEEKNLDRCLQSVAGVVDEMIVVDSGSTDGTEGIALSHGAKFVHNPWGGYSAQKNFGNHVASHDWILSLDADEALDDQLRRSVMDFKSSPTADACEMSRMTNYCGSWIRHSGWYPDIKLRLWDRTKGEWQGMIHETISMKEGTETIKLKGDILHYSFYSVTDHAAQMLRFTEVMAQDNVKLGKKGTYAKIFISPIFKFFQNYFLRLGFLDGYHGLVICIMSSYAAFFKYARTRELEKEQTKTIT